MVEKIKLPRNVLEKVRNIVYTKADTFDYMNQGRNQNGTFINNLATDPEVGGILKNYMSQQRIRTYIKDSILNRYAKDKIHSLLSIDIDKELSLLEEMPVYLIERKTIKSSTIHLYRNESNTLIVVGEGTVLKWETALRRALEFIEVCPGKKTDEGKWKIYVCLASTDSSLTQSDKEHIKNYSIYKISSMFVNKNRSARNR